MSRYLHQDKPSSFSGVESAEGAGRGGCDGGRSSAVFPFASGGFPLSAKTEDFIYNLFHITFFSYKFAA